jgi:hypothetical protein
MSIPNIEQIEKQLSQYGVAVGSSTGLNKLRDGSLSYSGEGFADVSRHHVYDLSPNNGFAAATFGGQKVRFDIMPGMFSKVEQARLEIVITEKAGTTGIHLPVPYLVEKVEVSCGDLNPIQITNSDWFYVKHCLYNDETNASLLSFNRQNMTTAAFAGESVVTASSTNYYYLQLSSNLVNKVNAQSLNKPVYVTVTFASSITVSGSATFELTSTRLRLLCVKNDKRNNEIVSYLNSAPLRMPYIETPIIEWTGTLTAGAAQEIPMQVDGFASGVVVMIRASKSATNAAIRTFSSLSNTTTDVQGTLDILDPSKLSILGDAPFTGQYIR